MSEPERVHPLAGEAALLLVCVVNDLVRLSRWTLHYQRGSLLTMGEHVHQDPPLAVIAFTAVCGAVQYTFALEVHDAAERFAIYFVGRDAMPVCYVDRGYDNRQTVSAAHQVDNLLISLTGTGA